MKIVDRYIARAVVSATLLVGVIIVSVQLFLALASQLTSVSKNGYTMWQACLYTLMQMPLQFYLLFPMVSFLGALIALSRLASTSQLIVLRASGVSIVRIAWSVLKAAILMVIIVTVVGEGFAPHWQQISFKAEKAMISPASHNDALLKSIWLHQNNTFTHIDTLVNSDTMTGITRYHFDESEHMTQAIHARAGRLENTRWKLEDLKQSIFTPGSVAISTEQTSDVHLAFQPNLQVSMDLDSNEQTLTNLFRAIVYRHSIGLSVNNYLFSFWRRILQPISTLVMVCLAVPFVFGSFRDASVSLRIMAGVFVGFAFYMLNQLFGPITLVYQFPPILAAILPTTIFLCIAIFLLARVK